MRGLLVQVQGERVEKRECAFDVRFGPRVLADPAVVDSIEDETGSTVVNGGPRRVLTVEPCACPGRQTFVPGFSSGCRHGIESAYDATDIERHDSGPRELLFYGWNQRDFRTAAGGFDQVRVAESHTSLGEGRLLQVSPEVYAGLSDLVG